MRHFNLLLLPAILPCLAVLAVAADPPPQEVRVPISPENAQHVHPIAEVPKSVYRIRRGPQRGELIFLDWDNAVEIVDDVNLRTLRTLVENDHPIDFAMSPDGKFLTWNERNSKSYTIQDTAGGKTFEIPFVGNPGHAAFSPGSKLLAIGDTRWSRDTEGAGTSEMKLFDLSGKLVRTLEKSGPGALWPVFSPDGKILAVGNRNHETRLFDVATGKLLHTLDKKMTQEIAFSPDGKALAAGYVDGKVALWNVETGKLRHSQPSGCKEVYSVAWSPNGKLLATSGRQGKIVLWEAIEFTKLAELDAPFWVIQVRFTADGTRLLSSSAADYGAKRDRKVVVWAVATGDE